MYSFNFSPNACPISDPRKANRYSLKLCVFCVTFLRYARFRIDNIRTSRSKPSKYMLALRSLHLLSVKISPKFSHFSYSSHLKRLSTLDSSWVVSAGLNGLAAHNSPSWLSLYLSVCKLLDLALALPAQQLPQFQMYQWAFVSEASENNNVENKPEAKATNGIYFYQDFVPYVVRVAKLLLAKSESVKAMSLKEGEPQLTMTSIFALDDLAPFFAAICESVTRQQTKACQSRQSKKMLRQSSTNRLAADSELINSIIERDFLENLSKQ